MPLTATDCDSASSTVPLFPLPPLEQPSPHPTISFVALDIAPRVGIRGPANFFAHPLDEDLDDLQAVLREAGEPSPSRGNPTGPGEQQEVATGKGGFQGSASERAAEGEIRGSNSGTGEGAVKIVMGHYPLSFATGAPGGRYTESVLSQGHCDAYLAGHLHYKFGTKMYRWYAPTSSSPSSSPPTSTIQGSAGHSPMSRSSFVEGGAEAGNRDASARSTSGSGSSNRVVGSEGQGQGQGQGGKDEHEGRGFWELGVGDWKDNRVMRIMAVDQGQISFTEFRLLTSVSKTSSKSAGNVFDGGAPVVVITSPQDARLKPRDPRTYSPTAPLLRALVFSSGNVTTVTALILRYTTTLQDSSVHNGEGVKGGAKAPSLMPPSAPADRKHLSQPAEPSWLDPVESLLLAQEPAEGGKSPVYSCAWAPQPYAQGAPGEYWVQVKVDVSGGGQYLSEAQPFVVDSGGQGESGEGQGETGGVKWVPMQQTWLEVGILGVEWEAWWPAVRWAPFLTIWAVLALLKALHVSLFWGVAPPDLPLAVYKRTRILVTRGERGTLPPRSLQRSLLLLPVSALEFFAFSLFSFGGEPAWWVLAVYLVYLGLGPWFLGYGLGTRCAPGWMSLWGWAIASCQPAAAITATAGTAGAGAGGAAVGALMAGGWGALFPSQQGLAVPDIVTTVVPIFFFCFVPVLLWVPLILGEGPFWHALRQEQGGQGRPGTRAHDQGQGYGLEKGSSWPHGSEVVEGADSGYSDTSETASLLHQSQDHVTLRTSSRSSLLAAEGPITDSGVPGRSPQGDGQCSEGAGQGVAAEKVWQGQGGRRGRQLGCCCLALSPCSCCQCLLRLLLWLCLLFPGLVYLHVSPPSPAFLPLALPCRLPRAANDISVGTLSFPWFCSLGAFCTLHLDSTPQTTWVPQTAWAPPIW